MAISAFKRYEMKFLLTQAQLDILKPLLLTYMKPDAYCRDGKNYIIYNIYYDTLNSDVIRHSLSKPYYKEKLRLRSYSIPTSLNDEVFLELKKKIGGIVNKRRAAMTLKEAYSFIESGKLPVVKGYMNQQVVNEIAYFLSKNEVRPTTYISYQRMAFFGKEDKEFRITLDSNINTRRNNLRLENASYGKQLIEGRYLMEVKISGAVPMWLANTLSDLQIYSTNFSKYGKEYMDMFDSKEAFKDDGEEEQKYDLCANY